MECVERRSTSPASSFLASSSVARTVFDFGAPGFWELVHDVRCRVLEAASAHDARLLVMTFCYAEPDDLPSLTDFEAIATTKPQP